MAINRIALATRKGILILVKEDSSGNKWIVKHEGFSGSHVSLLHLDRESGNLFACINDGHFGDKLFRWNNFLRDSDWETAVPKEVWTEIPAPKYPDSAKLPNGKEAILKYQWALNNGSKDQSGRLYLGTEPGGLFQSDDHGDHF